MLCRPYEIVSGIRGVGGKSRNWRETVELSRLWGVETRQTGREMVRDGETARRTNQKGAGEREKEIAKGTERFG